jgi:hypothetical protein
MGEIPTSEALIHPQSPQPGFGFDLLSCFMQHGCTAWALWSTRFKHYEQHEQSQHVCHRKSLAPLFLLGDIKAVTTSS